jgi:hypothetical protein
MTSDNGDRILGAALVIGAIWGLGGGCSRAGQAPPGLDCAAVAPKDLEYGRTHSIKFGTTSIPPPTERGGDFEKCNTTHIQDKSQDRPSTCDNARFYVGFEPLPMPGTNIYCPALVRSGVRNCINRYPDDPEDTDDFNEKFLHACAALPAPSSTPAAKVTFAPGDHDYRVMFSPLDLSKPSSPVRDIVLISSKASRGEEQSFPVRPEARSARFKFTVFVDGCPKPLDPHIITTN